MKQQLVIYDFLSGCFYDHYNPAQYPEMMHKRNRACIVCLVKIDDLTFAIPFRSNIKHNASLITLRQTTNSKNERRGIDFSKAVVINDEKYIDKSRFPCINRQEFNFLENKEFLILKGLKKFITEYKRLVQFKKKLPASINFQLCNTFT
jgi:protein AbiQ